MLASGNTGTRCCGNVLQVVIQSRVFGVDRFGAVAAAVGVLAGAVLLNGQAIESAFRRAAPRAV